MRYDDAANDGEHQVSFAVARIWIINILWFAAVGLTGYAVVNPPARVVEYGMQSPYILVACLVCVTVSAKYCQIVRKFQSECKSKQTRIVICYVFLIAFYIFCFEGLKVLEQDDGYYPDFLQYFFVLNSAYVLKSWFDLLRDEL